MLSASFIVCSILVFSGCKNSRTAGAGTQAAKKYQCIPCGYDCDQEIFDGPGTCPHCQMILVKQSTVKIKNQAPELICDFINQHPGLIILDVRTPDEFTGKADPDFGSLNHAINIPVQSLEARMGELNGYKDREILVYCSHSHRSPRAAYILSQNGFTKVINLAGGMSVVKDTTCIRKR